jgi:hypothetical protein
MSKNHYEAKDGAYLSNKDANVIASEFKKLRKKNGGLLTPKIIVEEASSPSSPLHKFFEWDDDAAAQKYRLTQARGLIYSVKVHIVEDPVPARTVTAFVRVETAKGPSYTEIRDAMKDDSFRSVRIARALQELKRVQQKYKDVVELDSIFQAINDAVEALTKPKKKKVKKTA